MNPQVEVEFLEAVHSREHVTGLTHGFYRYPARFSPLFARAAIKLFTKHGDIVLDPFSGEDANMPGITAHVFDGLFVFVYN